MKRWILAAALATAGCSNTGENAGNGGGAHEPPDGCRAVIEFRAQAPEGEGVRGLAKQGPGVIPVLIYVMTGEETQMAIAASEEMVRIGEPAVPALISLLESKAPHRGWATWTLGELGPAARGAREALRSAQSDPELRVGATEALRKIGE